MRLLSYRSDQAWRPGIQVGDHVVDAATLTASLDHPAEVRTTRDVLELGPTALAQLASMASSGREGDADCVHLDGLSDRFHADEPGPGPARA
jgi:hypothetical protein